MLRIALSALGAVAVIASSLGYVFFGSTGNENAETKEKVASVDFPPTLDIKDPTISDIPSTDVPLEQDDQASTTDTGIGVTPEVSSETIFSTVDEPKGSTETANLSENKQKIKTWIDTNYPNCKIKIKSGSLYVDYLNYGNDADLSALWPKLNSNSSYYKGMCRQGNSEVGRLGDSGTGALDGVIFKRETDRWVEDDDEEESVGS